MKTDKAARTETEVVDSFRQLVQEHTVQEIAEAVRDMEGVEQYNLLRSLRKLEQHITQ